MISVERLAGLPLFAEESRQVVSALARRGIEARFAPNEVMFLAGSEPRGWYVVLEGTVRVVRGSGSRQHVVHTETVGGTLGEVPLFGGGTHRNCGGADAMRRVQSTGARARDWRGAGDRLHHRASTGTARQAAGGSP